MKKRLSKKQKLAIGVATAVLVIAAVLVLSRRVVSAKQTSGAEPYTVRAEIYENVIEIAGTVSAAKEQSLEALNDGTVIGVYVKEGDRVKKGDLILQEDDSEQQYNLANLDYEISVARQNQTAGKLKLMETQRFSLLRKIENRKIVATFDGVIADSEKLWVSVWLETLEKEKILFFPKMKN